MSDIYMATVVWRGRMHVDPLRVFVGPTAQTDAAAYAATLDGGTPVVYRVDSKGPPKKLSLKNLNNL